MFSNITASAFEFGLQGVEGYRFGRGGGEGSGVTGSTLDPKPWYGGIGKFQDRLTLRCGVRALGFKMFPAVLGAGNQRATV